MADLIGKLIVSLFSGLDYFLYNLASSALNLIFDLADYQFFAPETIKDFANRIYVILGVLMLFKVVISFIQMLINPDKVVDKENGLGGLLKRTILTVAFLALVPTVFAFATEIQKPISEMIPKIILGVGTTNGNVSEEGAKNTGNKMAYQIWSTFVDVKEGKSGTIAGKFLNNKVSETGEINSLVTLHKYVNEKYDTYSYVLFIPTVVAIFLVYILVSMALDIAIRVFKFAILQLLAPIAIASYIDPQTAKTTFSVWGKTCVKVYCDLFVRLMVVYFIIFTFNTALSGTALASIYKYFDGKTNGTARATFVLIFIILGLLLFAKKAPGFIMDTLGIKQNDDLKDMFSPAWKRAGALGGLAGIGAAGIGNAINKSKGLKSNGGWEKGKRLRSAFKVAGSAIAGATSAGLHGGVAAIKGKNSSEVFKAGAARAIKARQNREIDAINGVGTYAINGVGTYDRFKVKLHETLGLDTQASLAEGKQEAYTTLHQDVGNFKKAVMGRIVKVADVAMPVSKSSSDSMSQLGQLLYNNATAIRSSGNIDLINYMDRFENKIGADGKSYFKLKKGSRLSYHDIAAINTDATQAGIGSVANLTAENGALTLLAQKELFCASMNGQIKSTNGQSLDELNVGSGRTHVDILTAVGQAEQHITENALNLGTITLKNGRVVKGATDIKNVFKSNFGALDDAAQKQSAELSSKISSDPEAAARASIQRRNQNKNDSK